MFKEEDHPRLPKGNPGGGEFTMSGGKPVPNYILDKMDLPTVTSESVIPENGKPFQFAYLHNKEKSPNMGERFGQHIEPAGKYVVVSDGQFAKGKSNFETGVIRFQKPLVIDFGGGYQEKSNWKYTLSNRYNNKTGKALSSAIRKDGYDGIITVSKSRNTLYTSEIVVLDPEAIKK